jgi:protein-glutamine gamma-glutamyltransferase
MNESQKIILPIIAALVVAIFPHIGRLPLWIVLWCGIMWGYTLLSLRFQWQRPGKTLRTILAVSGMLGLLLTFSHRLDQDAYLGLLAVMAALKPFEMVSHRDRMITCFLAYFIVITSLFLSETLLMTIYMLISVGVTTAVLIRINDPGGRIKENLKLSGVIMAQAIPLTLLLFFLFPRIEGSLFGLWFSNTAKTGFSELLSPGGVARLVENNDVAFRASFEGGIPHASRLYWRGIVFDEFDGRTWHASRHAVQADRLPEGREPIAYTVMLEPHHYRWLFALDMPARSAPQAEMLTDYTLRASHWVNRKIRYEMTSYLHYHTGPEDEQILHKSTRLPADINPGARRLAAEITADAGTVAEKAGRVFDFFRDNGFVYTLFPPRLGRDSVDDFIFSARRGYCEHYASAFAFMMRSINVPARVVGGYLGGEANPYADYLIVRQSDAHAWVEIWDPEKGWMRMDPTAAVAPDRILEGPQSALPAGEMADFFDRKYLKSISGFFQQVRFRWDAVSIQWSAFFEGYSYDAQQALLARIGIRPGMLSVTLKAVLLLLAMAGMILGACAWVTMRPTRFRTDPVEKYYARFCDKLARAGLPRKPHQGPVDYLRDVVKHRPELEHDMVPVMDLYVSLRYRDQISTLLISEFIRKVRRFDPKPR